MGYKVYTVSTISWVDKIEIRPSACSWARAMNEGAGGSARFVLSDPNVALTIAGGAVDVVNRCLVVEFDNVVVYAGIIWESDYDHDTQELTIQHEDIWSLWELRLISESKNSAMPSWKQTYSGLEYDTIAKRLVQLATTGAGRTVPLVYEDDYSGGRSRTYYGYDADTLVEALEEIMDLPGGPDIDFRPEWNPDRSGLQWTVRTGFMNPDNQVVEVNFSAPKPPARGLKVKTSGRERATQVFGIGEGSGKDMKVQSAGGSGSFALERAEQSKNIKDAGQLQDFAAGEHSTRGSNVRQYSFEVPLDSPIVGSLWTLKPGMTLRWHVTGDPYLSSGWRDSMVIQYQGDIASDFVSMETQ